MPNVVDIEFVNRYYRVYDEYDLWSKDLTRFWIGKGDYFFSPSHDIGESTYHAWTSEHASADDSSKLSMLELIAYLT